MDLLCICADGGMTMNGKELLLPILACVLAVLLAAAVGVRLLSDGEAIRSASAVVWML